MKGVDFITTDFLVGFTFHIVAMQLIVATATFPACLFTIHIVTIKRI